MSHEPQLAFTEWLQRKINFGYLPAQELFSLATELFVEDDFDEDELEAQFAEAYEAWMAAQTQWPAQTDCDRLDAAFATLATQGIVARQNFTCCQTCGLDEIGDEIFDEEARGMTVRGFLFFHQQDIDQAIANGRLMLRYSDSEVGRSAVAALQRAGLRTAWDGDVKKCIEVTLDWKRRPANADDPGAAKARSTVWAEAYVKLAPRAAADKLPLRYGEALVAVGLLAQAERWAVAHSDVAANARVGRALQQRGDLARARAVLIAGYRRFPAVKQWVESRVTLNDSARNALPYVDLLATAGLADEEVAAVAYRRIDSLPWNLYTAAAKAWFVCAQREAGRQAPSGWLEDAREVWLAAPPDHADIQWGRCALAALWQLGVLDTDDVLEVFADPGYADRQGTLVRALVHAAAARGEASRLIPLMPRFFSEADLECELLRNLPRDEAISFVESWEDEPHRQRTGFLLLAQRAPELYARAIAMPDRSQEYYADGLLLDEELAAGQLATVLGAAAANHRGEALVLLLSFAAQSAAYVPAHREQIFAAPAVFDAQSGRPEEAAITADIATMRAADTDRGKALRLARRLLKAATWLGQAGEASGGKLLDIVLLIAQSRKIDMWEAPLAALLANGRLDEALAFERKLYAECGAAHENVAAVASALLSVGRRDEAIERIEAAIPRAHAADLPTIARQLLRLGDSREEIERALDSAHAIICGFSTTDPTIKN